jgi:hypothetical protein
MSTFRKLVIALMLSGILLVGSGCMTLTHQVGNGAQTTQQEEKRQWYLLWGLVPLNEVDSQEMAGGATNYTVKSEVTIIDALIGAVLGWVTISSQTVTVAK